MHRSLGIHGCRATQPDGRRQIMSCGSTPSCWRSSIIYTHILPNYQYPWWARVMSKHVGLICQVLQPWPVSPKWRQNCSWKPLIAHRWAKHVGQASQLQDSWDSSGNLCNSGNIDTACCSDWSNVSCGKKLSDWSGLELMYCQDCQWALPVNGTNLLTSLAGW